MEDDHSNDKATVDTAKADRSVWLMKCPPVVSKSWQSSAATAAAAESPTVAKVVVSLDLLRPEDPPALQFTMEMAAGESVAVPKSYSLNMFKDFVPMAIFSETTEGRVAMEGKVEHKFDMKPHHANLEEYRKLCRERTNKSMVKNRQIQVLDNDRGVHMRPMPGMMGLVTSTSKQFMKEILNELCVYNKRGANQGTYELKPEYKKSAEDAVAE
ncbi:transcription initiation factor IIF subunit beta [Striga asiatica]|uniref:Transcription initiation factor IIF subunit beta n=1 Tax=Striga asiatica TaxID=4170 RepID=A0A5A7QDN7_STRAF|nr:transcription initiation factor IIF subunit beta [Striga asiatica]